MRKVFQDDLGFVNEAKFGQKNLVFFQIVCQKHLFVRSDQLNDLIFIRDVKFLIDFLSEIRECLILIKYHLFFVPIQKNIYLKGQLFLPNIRFNV
jgi:hypothetical protein